MYKTKELISKIFLGWESYLKSIHFLDHLIQSLIHFWEIKKFNNLEKSINDSEKFIFPPLNQKKEKYMIFNKESPQNESNFI